MTEEATPAEKLAPKRAPRARKPKEVPAEPEEVQEAEIVEDENVDQATGEVYDEPIHPSEVLDMPRVHAMMTSLPQTSDMTTWTEEQMALLDAAGLVKRKGNAAPQWAPRATVAAFLQQCARTGLDPIARQIYCIERAGKWTIQISIDGARLVAQRSGEYRGQTAAQWTADGVNWFDVWLFDGPPRAARVGVYREGFIEPLYAVARYDSYVPMQDEYTGTYPNRKKTGKQVPGPMWIKMPDVMLAKVAEMLALRKAFPQDLSGLYSSEEMEQASNAIPAARPALTAAPTVKPIAPEVVAQHEVAPAEPEGEARWLPWRDAIDDATLDRLGALRLEAASILGNIVPGTDYTVADYFEKRRLELVGHAPVDPLKSRMQQGLQVDGRDE